MKTERAQRPNGRRIPQWKALPHFRSGKTVAEIAAERGLAASTIEGHLSFYIYKGCNRITEMVTEEKKLLIRMLLKVMAPKNCRL